MCVYIYMHQILELNIVMNMMMNLHEALRCCSRRPFLDDGSAKHGRFPSPCQINYWRREWWTLIILIWSRLILGWIESGLGNTPKAKWWVQLGKSGRFYSFEILTFLWSCAPSPHSGCLLVGVPFWRYPLDQVPTPSVPLVIAAINN